MLLNIFFNSLYSPALQLTFVMFGKSDVVCAIQCMSNYVACPII